MDPPAHERREMEFEADMLAQQTLIDVSASQPSWHSILGGGIAFLMCDYIREKVFCDLHAIRPGILSKSGNHPPAMGRIERLDRTLSQYYETHPESSKESLAPLSNLKLLIMELNKMERWNP